MTVTWNGRAYVEEDRLTQEQYDTFFEHGEHNIKFDIANLILAEHGDEVVPCDELKPEVRARIAEQMMHDNGGFVSMVSADGNIVRLSWRWKPTITDDDGRETSFELLPYRIMRKIISDMLEKQCVWGIVD